MQYMLIRCLGAWDTLSLMSTSCSIKCSALNVQAQLRYNYGIMQKCLQLPEFHMKSQ